jgi:uncharacterized membrane protein
MNDLLQSVLVTVIPLLGTLLSVFIGYLIAYLKKKTEALQNQYTRELIDRVLDEAQRAIEQAVMATEQEYVRVIKDGKLTREQAEEAKRRANETFRKLMTVSSLQILNNVVSDLNEFIDNAIENYVAEMHLYEDK